MAGAKMRFLRKVDSKLPYSSSVETAAAQVPTRRRSRSISLVVIRFRSKVTLKHGSTHALAAREYDASIRYFLH